MTPMPPDLLARLGPYGSTRVEAGESGGTVHRLAATGLRTLFLKEGGGVVAEAITDEMARLAWLAGRVAVPELVQFVRADGPAWLLTTAVSGETTEVQAKRGDVSALVEPMAAFLRALHALPVDECPFDSSAPVRLAAARSAMAAGSVDADDFDDEHRGWTPEQVWERMMALRPAGFGRVVTHGDFSLGNLLVENGRVTGCIDVGRTGVADPYQDLAICWANWEEIDAGLGERFLAAYGLETVDRDRLAFHLCLDEFF